MPENIAFQGMLLDFETEIRSCDRLKVGRNETSISPAQYTLNEHNNELVFCHSAFSDANKNTKNYPDFRLRPTSNLLQLRIRGSFFNNMNNAHKKNGRPMNGAPIFSY